MSANEVSKKVQQLEHAIRHLDSLKKHLNQNASNVKVEIHESVGQILKDLWGQEVSLLNQVDQTLRVKEDVLQNQQVRLSQDLRALQTDLSMILNGAASGTQLNDIIDKLKRVELTPEKMSCISFRAELGNLRDSILNYGRVDGNGLPLMTTFGSTSESLPCHEYYDQADNGCLFKPVEEVKNPQISASSISVPQFSNHIENWLQKPNQNTKTEDSNVPVILLPSKCPDKLTGSGDASCCRSPRNPTSGIACSTSGWLMEQDLDMKMEQDFDICEGTRYQKAGTDTWFSGIGSQNNTDFIQPIGLDLKSWLSPGSGHPSDVSSAFSHLANDSKVWLLQACQQLNSLNELKHKDFFQHVSKEPSSWLCSQAYRRDVARREGRDEAGFFSHISKDKDCWLQKRSKTNSVENIKHDAGGIVTKLCDTKTRCCRKIATKEDNEKWLATSSASTSLFQMKDICKANELCGNISECVSQPDCCTLWFREKSHVKNVVDPTQAFKPLSLTFHDWLLPVSQKHPNWLGTAQNKMETNDHFQHIPNVSDSIWLMKPALPIVGNVSTAPSPPSRFKGDKEESNLWLQKTGYASFPEPSPCTETVRSSSDINMSDWLMVTNEEDNKHQEVHDHDKESEGWSICSDSHSASTDQHVKDIAAADEYFSKWLI